MNELANMTRAELEGYLARLKEDLEDCEEENSFVLGQTGVHVAPKEVQKYQARLESFRTRIAEAEGVLQSRGPAAAE